METDRLLTPSKEVQKAVESLWQVMRRAGDIMAAKQQHDADMRQRISLLEAEIESKTEQIATHVATLESWKGEIAEIDDLRASVKSLYEKLNDGQTILREKDQRIEQLVQEAEGFRIKSTDAESLRTQLHRAEQELLSWQARAQNLEASLQQRSEQVADAESTLRRTQQEMHAGREASAQLVDTLKQEQQETVQTLSEVRKSFQELERTHDSVRQENSRLQRDLDEIRVRLQRQDDATQEYKSQLMEMTARMYEREKQALLAEEKLTLLESIDRQQQENTVDDAVLRSELEDYRARVQQFEEELKVVRSEVQRVTEQRDQLTLAAEQFPESPLSKLASSIRQTADYLSQGEHASPTSGLNAASKETVYGIVDKLRSAVKLLESAVAS